MNPLLIIFSVLIFSSMVLCIAMTLAWIHFGRQRHALSWALAYGGGVLQWTVNAAGLMLFPDHLWPFVIASMLVVATSSLVAIGCRQRAGLPVHVLRFIAVGALATIAIAIWYTHIPFAGMRGAFTALYAAAMMPIAIAAVRPRRRKAQAPEIAFIVMLTIFGVFQLIVAGAGLAVGPEGDVAAIARYREIVGIGLPPVNIGLGIAALFLLAGDLADSVRALVTRDPLTGNLNRRGIEQAAIGAIANARRHGRPLVTVIGDIDRFKTINDRYGHAAGDQALIAFADHVHASVREEDLFGRIGGDEFCLLLIDAAPEDAAEAIERTRRELAQMEVAGMPGFSMSASFGMAAFDPDDVCFGDMLHRADLALLEAKLAGRDRLVVAPPPKPRVSGTAAR
ncbi:sensor domain-containing diguanylate cyclase [Sphingomonas cavernae]|uniref:diguanylate cyclase n=1 Tax=Sphingomonas cavernae TaxID=2320861 RepID=A0A418WM20_9SPHN|nr:GGDEF domain-containing protein [Sphingomonas cavernae]RJF91047.1 GGDEF domain-containing protein [Sphingomonas cavernae]